jgi:hypothetical protein
MKKLIVSSLVMLMSASAFAKTVSSSEVKLNPSSVDQVIRLVDKNEPGSSHKKLSIIVEDRGMSTDVSPRYSVSLGYASLAEMGNISADFKINENAYQFLSATRKAPGIYEVRVVEYRDEDGMVEVTQTIDATKMFSDEQKLRKQCGGDFCDQTLKTSVDVKETAKKQ